MLCVAHIETKDIGALVDEATNHFFGFGGWAESDNDFSFA